MKKRLPSFICSGCLLTGAVFGQSPVTLTIDARSPGYEIPANFSGLSIFTETQRPGHRGTRGNLFSASNRQLVALFKNSGIHHLRLGATVSSLSIDPNLDTADIDSLFAFARAADIRIIYSLHALDGASTAQYVWDHYRPWLDCFAFDNEPDNRGEGGSGTAAGHYAAYLAGWRDFTRTVTDAVPGAKFAGPDAAGRNLAPHFADDEEGSGVLTLDTQHIYVGGNPQKKGVATATQAIDNMLSQNWDTDKYPGLYHDVFIPVMKDGFRIRLTESDDYTHGVTNASNAFASALWALDYLHWWAAHGAAGINFQNTEWLTTDTFHPDSSGNYQLYPKAYGIRAFDLGGHGRVESVAIADKDTLNLTAYAVGDATNLYVTIINKEHGGGARAAAVTLALNGFASDGFEAMFLTAPNGDAGATSGITLGGASITNDAPWHGQWTALDPLAIGQCKVTIPATSAAIIKISSR